MSVELKELNSNSNSNSGESPVNPHYKFYNQKLTQIEFQDIRTQNTQIMKRLIFVTSVSFTFMISEIIGGYLAHSIAIMSDAAHLSSDVAGFVIQIISIKLCNRSATRKEFSYGYPRAEILGSLASILLIWGLTCWLLYEATWRLIYGSETNGGIMLITSILALCFNLIMGAILNTNISGKIETLDEIQQKRKLIENKEKGIQPDDSSNQLMDKTEPNPSSHESLQIKAAIVHILGDTVQSIGVIIAAAIIYNFPDADIADPICTYLFSIIVFGTTSGVVAECLDCLMETTPESIDLKAILEDFRQLEDIVDIHDLHIWSLTSGKISLSAHITTRFPTKTLIEADIICNKHGIYHTTIQTEQALDTIKEDKEIQKSN